MCREYIKCGGTGRIATYVLLHVTPLMFIMAYSYHLCIFCIYHYAYASEFKPCLPITLSNLLYINRFLQHVWFCHSLTVLVLEINAPCCGDCVKLSTGYWLVEMKVSNDYFC